MRAFLLTGATGTLGPFVAQRLLERGDAVALHARDGIRLARLADDLARPERVTWRAGDLLAGDEAAAAACAAHESFGRLDGLVHLVGTFDMGTPAATATTDRYLDLYRSNVLTAVTSSAAVLPLLGDEGHLVFMSSLLAEQPMPRSGPYAAAKAALHAWVRALSREVRGRGVHANVIMTSRIDTPARRALFPDADHSTWVSGDDLAALAMALTSSSAALLHGTILDAVGTFALEPPHGAVRLAAAGARP